MTGATLFVSAVVGYALGIATVVLPLIERRRELPSSDWSERDFGDLPNMQPDVFHNGTNTRNPEELHAGR